MNPTQGKCKDCKHGTIPVKPDAKFDLWCSKIEDNIYGWWTGCVMWKRREDE